MSESKISRLRSHFKALKEDVLPRFNLIDTTPRSTNQLEDYHSISEFKRKFDNIRPDVNAFGIYSNLEFDLIYTRNSYVPLGRGLTGISAPFKISSCILPL